jgi:dihydrofolate synthase/folylpolyglutamate synthase
VEPFNGLIDDVVLTQANLNRSATVEELLAVIQGAGDLCIGSYVPPGALADARLLARREDLICVTGSLMLVGEVKASLRACGLSPLRG